MQQIEAKLALAGEDILGEGPVWDEKENKVLWIDIKSRKIRSWYPATNQEQQWELDQMVGSISLTESGQLICALQDQIILFDTSKGQSKRLCQLEADLPDNRANDGKPDAMGRLWIGTLHIPGEKGHASLYKWEANQEPVRMLSGLGLSNGMAWTPDSKRMYLVDTLNHHLLQFQFDLSTGHLSDQKIIIRFDSSQGSPDGLCLDRDGMLWIAFYGGKRVGRYDPDTGGQIAEIAVPAVNVTSCAFGGEHLDHLYITTARDGVSEEMLEQYPLTGSLFVAMPCVKGFPANRMRV